MPEPKSALEKLLAAASAELPTCGCGYYHDLQCARVQASRTRDAVKEEIEDLADPMARAGQALAEAAGWIVDETDALHQRWASDDCEVGQCPMCDQIADWRKALATWNALGEAKEGQGGQ